MTEPERWSTAPTCWAPTSASPITAAATPLQDHAEGPADRRDVEVLWVKGSGGDVGSIKLDGFATLYMDKLRALKRSIAASTTKTRWSATCRIAPST
jgi:hypothetical protein